MHWIFFVISLFYLDAHGCNSAGVIQAYIALLTVIADIQNNQNVYYLFEYKIFFNSS